MFVSRMIGEDGVCKVSTNYEESMVGIDLTVESLIQQIDSCPKIGSWISTRVSGSRACVGCGFLSEI